MIDIRPSIALPLLLVSLPVAAIDFRFGEGIAGRIESTVTAGTIVRSEAPDPSLYGTLFAARVGLPPGQLGGNSGRNNLNFVKDRPASTVLKGVVDLELQSGHFALFARARGWHDFELRDGDRPYGHAINGFRRNAPLDDAGLAADARFSNLRLADLWLSGKFPLADETTLDLRLGRQTVSWGTARLLGGGLDVVNPLDVAALVRPGAQPQETRVPVGMLHAELAGRAGWGVAAFYQYEFRHNVLPPCGSFFDNAYYVPPGCNFVSVLGGAGIDDATALSRGLYPKRAADVLARDVRGYSHDGVYVEGRRIVRPGLRAEWGKRYFAELNYSRLSGGAYHLQADRDHVTLFVGL